MATNVYADFVSHLESLISQEKKRERERRKRVSFLFLENASLISSPSYLCPLEYEGLFRIFLTAPTIRSPCPFIASELSYISFPHRVNGLPMLPVPSLGSRTVTVMVNRSSLLRVTCSAVRRSFLLNGAGIYSTRVDSQIKDIRFLSSSVTPIALFYASLVWCKLSFEMFGNSLSHPQKCAFVVCLFFRDTGSILFTTRECSPNAPQPIFIIRLICMPTVICCIWLLDNEDPTDRRTIENYTQQRWPTA